MGSSCPTGLNSLVLVGEDFLVFNYLFIYFQLYWVFIATCRLLILVTSLVVEHIIFKDFLLYLKCYNHPLPSHQAFLQGKYW